MSALTKDAIESMLDISPDALLGTHRLPPSRPPERRLTMALDRKEIAEIAHEAARAAVAEIFLTLGGDTTSPDGVLRLQEDFMFLRMQRESVAAFKTGLRRTFWGVLSAVVLGGVAYLMAALHLPAPISPP